LAEKTNKEIEMARDRDTAAAALEKADAAELHQLFQRAQKQYGEMEEALTKVMVHYIGSKDVPRYEPNNDNAVAAMERIASEAIALARFVVETANK